MGRGLAGLTSHPPRRLHGCWFAQTYRCDPESGRGSEQVRRDRVRSGVAPEYCCGQPSSESVYGQGGPLCLRGQAVALPVVELEVEGEAYGVPWALLAALPKVRQQALGLRLYFRHLPVQKGLDVPWRP